MGPFEMVFGIVVATSVAAVIKSYFSSKSRLFLRSEIDRLTVRIEALERQMDNHVTLLK